MEKPTAFDEAFRSFLSSVHRLFHQPGVKQAR